MTEATTGRDLAVAVWRGDAAGGGFVDYAVPARANQTVLDVVTWIQRHLEPTLGYRFACHVGMCGSCAMMVNGEPRWTCRTHVKRVAGDGRLRLAPLRNLPVIKDLAADMRDFFDAWQRAEGRFVGSATRAADAAVECINCAVCYAACDVVAWNPDYPGPAALNRAWTLVNDVRDADRAGHLRAVAGPAGCHSCHSHQSCSEFCPNDLSPTASIAGLKRRSLLALLKGEF